MAEFEIIDGKAIIPHGTREIPEYAFRGCTGLTSIEIPNSVTEIGGGAFRGCTGLTSIKFSSNVMQEMMHPYRNNPGYFSECQKISDIYFGPQVQPQRFNNCDKIFDFDISVVTLHVPIGMGYEYRHHPYFGKFKAVVADVRD